MNRHSVTAILTCVLTGLAGPANAQVTGRHDTPECDDALIALRTDPSVAALRSRAAQLCLGANPDVAPRGRRPVQTPIAVTTIPVAPIVAPVAVPPSPPASIAPPVVAPTSVTSCDPGGCWANDGSRLHRFDPYVIGPRGLCVVQGTALQCPP